MPAQLLNGEQTFLDANGNPLAGGTVGLYLVGTLTPKTSWRDAAGTTPNANPVVLDSAGRAVIYGSAGAYRQIVKDAVGVLQWDLPTYPADSESFTFAGRAGGTGNALTLSAPNFSAQIGQRIGFIADQNCAAGTATLQVNPQGVAYPLFKDSTNDPPLTAALDQYDLSHGCYYEVVFDQQPETAQAYFWHFRVPLDTESLGNFVQRAGDTMTGPLDVGTSGSPQKITTFYVPVGQQDVTNKLYVDGTASGAANSARTSAISTSEADAATKYPTNFRFSASFLDSSTTGSSAYPGSAMTNAFNPGGGNLQIERRYLQFQVNGSWLTAVNAP